MKKLHPIVLCLFCTAVLFAMEVGVSSFTAKSNGTDITLNWESSREVELQSYEIQRSTQSQGDFKSVATISAKGIASRYEFVDENAYMKGGSGSTTEGTVYYYRLKMSGNGKTTLSDPITVTHNVSSVRRTWGMIKEMFR